jgi:dihydrofolate reductase
MKLVLVAAIGENNVIGRGGQLPWRLKSDMQHFKRLTLNKPVIMGRKTYESIGKPLKDRTNIVLTRDLSLVAPGTVLALGMDAALATARQDAAKRGTDEIMVIGGSDVFADLMPQAARLEITHVHGAPEGDTYFPPIDPADWRQTAYKEHPPGPDDSVRFAIATYVRR